MMTTKHKFFSLILAFCSMSTNTMADNIINDLETSKTNQGKIKIHQSEQINNLLNKKKAENSKKTQMTFSGYRIQAYMGNRQKISKDEAEGRQNKIKQKFPELNTYLTFASPFWKLRIGDFRNHAEAMVLAQSLKSSFPEMANDIYIVRDPDVINVEMEKEEENQEKKQ